jgi:hypothetical protein
MRCMDTLSPSPDLSTPWASVWEQRLLDYLRHHAANEGQMLREYVEAAQDTDSKALAFLIELLAADERRHHAWFSQLADTIVASSAMAADPPIPHLDLDRAETFALPAVTKRLIANERSDLKELKALRKELKVVEDTTLWALVVDLMIRDTGKHLAILRFAQSRGQRQVH